MDDNYLFQKVKCDGFIHKINDGRYIGHDEEWNCWYVKGYDSEKKDYICEDIPEENYDGSLNFLKTYYQEKKQRFSGVVVGFKDVVINGFLYVDTSSDYRGCEYTYIGKQPKDIERCAIVYYANNMKHLVPIRLINGLE